MTAITLDLHSIIDLTEHFYQLCQKNPDIKRTLKDYYYAANWRRAVKEMRI